MKMMNFNIQTVLLLNYNVKQKSKHITSLSIDTRHSVAMKDLQLFLCIISTSPTYICTVIHTSFWSQPNK